jgi:hypothetical protein
LVAPWCLSHSCSYDIMVSLLHSHSCHDWLNTDLRGFEPSTPSPCVTNGE